MRPRNKQRKLPDSLTSMPVGSKVRVRLDDGSRVETVTTSICWQLGHGAWVVKTAATGAGGYDLQRITPLLEKQPAAVGGGRRSRCIVCGSQFGVMPETDMCGPCTTGDASTVGEL